VLTNPLQVPQAIAAALKHQPGKPAPSCAVQMACVDSLLAFSTAAANSNIVAKTASGGTLNKQAADGIPLTPENVRKASVGKAQHATGLALSAAKQLQQSGFAELLPQLLSDAAAALAGLSDADILAWAAGTPQEGIAMLLGDSSTGNVVPALQNHACASFNLLNMLWWDYPFTDTVRHQVLGPSLLPALQLLSTMHQFAGRCADLLPADPQQINPIVLSVMRQFVRSAIFVLSKALLMVLEAGLTAFQAAQISSAGQDTPSLGAAPGQLSLWDAPAIKALASADLLGACCLALLYSLSADMLQPLLLEAHKIPTADDAIASMGVAASGVDGSSSSSSSGTTGSASSSRLPAASSSGSSGSSKAAGTRPRQNPIAGGFKQNAAAWKLACSDTLQLPSPFTHMISLLGYSRRALIFPLTAAESNHLRVNTAAGFAASLTAAPRQLVGPNPSPGELLRMVSACLQAAESARQSPGMKAGTLQRLSTILQAALKPLLQQHGQPEAQDTDTPTQQQPQPGQQQVEAGVDADWEAQMHHTLLAVVLVWLGQPDLTKKGNTAKSYAETLSDAAVVMGDVASRINQECGVAKAEAVMRSAPHLMQSGEGLQQQRQQQAQGMNPGVVESPLAQCTDPGLLQDWRPPPTASPWATPAMQEVGLLQLLSTACQQLLGHLDSLPADSTATLHIAGQSSAASQGRSSSGASSSTATSRSTNSNIGSGSNTVNRSKATSSSRTGSRGSSSSRNDRSGSGGGAPDDALRALGSVAESISLLAGMSLPDESFCIECKGYHSTPAEIPFSNLLPAAQLELQNAVYVHHSTTSQAYTTWRQQFVRLASVLEVHMRVSSSSNSPLQSCKEALTAGSCLLNPKHPTQLRSSVWSGTVAMDAALQAGPGSREEQQLFSLACSLLKACSTRLMGGQLEPHDQVDIEAHLMSIGTMACSLIMQATMLLKGQGADSEISSGGTPTAAVSSTGSVSLAPGTVSSSSCEVSGTVESSTTNSSSSPTTGIKDRSAVLVVPWLVLLGRFCLCWSFHALTVSKPHRRLTVHWAH